MISKSGWVGFMSGEGVSRLGMVVMAVLLVTIGLKQPIVANEPGNPSPLKGHGWLG